MLQTFLDWIHNSLWKPDNTQNKDEKLSMPIENKPVIPKDLKVEQLYLRIKDSAYKFLEEAKTLNAFIFMGYRTFAEQDVLYAQGRTKPGKIVTNAKGGYSYHNYGLALDCVFKDNKGNWTWDSILWKKLGEIGIKYGFEWGGSWSQFPDRPHFQIAYKQSINDLLKIYNKTKKLENVWAYLDTLKG